MSTPHDDYPYIRAWGRMMGSSADYIETQVAQARADAAPASATYQDRDGRWSTTDSVWRWDTRRQLGLDPLPPRDTDPDAILAELAEAARGSAPLRELYGLHTSATRGGNELRLEFTTGAVLTLRLHPAAKT